MSADKSGCLHMHTHIHSASIVPPTWRHAQQDKQMTSKCAAKPKSKKKHWFCKKKRKQTAKLWIIVLGVSFTPVSLIFFPFFFVPRFLKWKICVDVSQLLAPLSCRMHRCTTIRQLFGTHFFPAFFISVLYCKCWGLNVQHFREFHFRCKTYAFWRDFFGAITHHTPAHPTTRLLFPHLLSSFTLWFCFTELVGCCSSHYFTLFFFLPFR